MMLLSLDQNTTTGYAYGEPGTRPTSGVKNFGARRTNGEVIYKFSEWLWDLCDTIRPDLVAFESPWMPRGKKQGNALTVRRIMGVACEIEAVIYGLNLVGHRIRLYEVTVRELSLFFLGNANLRREDKKAATIATCARYGWVTASDDEADGLSLWAMMEATIAPDIAAQRGIGPLMLTPPAKERRRAA